MFDLKNVFLFNQKNKYFLDDFIYVYIILNFMIQIQYRKQFLLSAFKRPALKRPCAQVSGNVLNVIFKLSQVRLV
jgi:hypothetical protein